MPSPAVSLERVQVTYEVQHGLPPSVRSILSSSHPIMFSMVRQPSRSQQLACDCPLVECLDCSEYRVQYAA